jgi:Kef-type K+ transport system membrane component KefB
VLYIFFGVGESWFLVENLPAELIAMESTCFYVDDVQILLGTILSPTRADVTQRMLKDINKLESIKQEIILGAAVIDVVRGLIIPAVSSGIISSAKTGQTMNVSWFHHLIGATSPGIVGTAIEQQFSYPLKS